MTVVQRLGLTVDNVTYIKRFCIFTHIGRLLSFVATVAFFARYALSAAT